MFARSDAGASFIKKSLLFMALLLVAGGAYGLWATGLSLHPAEFVQGAFFGALWLVLAIILRRFQGDPRLVAMFEILALTVLFCLLGFVWTYTSVALRRPMIDAAFATFDAKLGFDWPSFHAWVVGQPILRVVLMLAYDSFVAQMAALTLWFCWRGHISRAWELAWLFWASLFVCEVVSRVWLSVGAFGYFHIATDTPYVREYMALYDGALRVIGAYPAQGLIQFPSFHAAAAIVYAYVTRGMPVLFPLSLALNALMLVGVLPVGGHYLVDLLGGVVVAFAVILTLRRVARRPA